MVFSKSFNNIKYSVLILKSGFCFVLSDKKFILIPNFITMDYSSKDSLVFGIKENTHRVEFNRFLRKFSLWSQSLSNTYARSIILTGLGYKMFLLENKTRIQFKLGYSHLVIKNVPKGLKVILVRNRLRVSGYDKSKVGNFLNSIRLLKLPNMFKGKGFWYKYQAKNLKEVKKK